VGLILRADGALVAIYAASFPTIKKSAFLAFSPEPLREGIQIHLQPTARIIRKYFFCMQNLKQKMATPWYSKLCA